jgi:hypothetical protein
MNKRKPVIEVMDDDMAAVFRAKTGLERLMIADAMYTRAREMLLSHLRFEHPDWNEQQVNREAARRLSHGAV